MAMKALIFAALLGVTVCGPTITSHGDSGVLKPKLGSKRCTFGPSYWCDHISKAAECGMTDWCIDKVWQHMDLPEDHDDICDICLDMVTQARDQLNSNETQEELKEVLEGSCNLIPVHIIAEECDNMVDQFIPQLVQVLSSEMNPQVVCQTAGLCNSRRVDKLLEDFNNKKAAEKPVVDTCATCERRTEALVEHVATGGQQQLLDNLLPICRDFGSYSDACSADLATNIGVIYEFLQNIDSEGVCLLGNACPGLYAEKPLELQATGPSVDCDLCIHIVKHWRDILVANTTKEEFKEILDGICAKTKSWAPKCTQLVNDYYLIIYDFLVNDIRAHTICKAIGICRASTQTPLGMVVLADSEASHVLKSSHQPLIPLHLPVVEMAPLTPSKPAVEVSEPSHELHTVAMKRNHVLKAKKLHRVQLSKSPPRAYGNDGLSHMNPLESSPAVQPAHLPLSRLGLPDLSHLFQRNTELCDLCEFGLREIQKELMKDATEDEITDLVERTCEYLPTTLEASCRRFVEEYSTFVITLLAQEIDPTEVCPALRLCPLPSSEEAELGAGHTAELVSSPSDDEEPEDTVSAAPGCAICEYAMNTLLDYLKDKKTEREIRDGLDRVCDMLPHTVAHECEELVNTFTEELIDMIASGLTADEICITLHLCYGETPGLNDIEFNSIHAVPPSMSAMGPFGMRFAGLSAPLSGLPVNYPQMAGQPEEWGDSSEEEEDDDDESMLLPPRVKRPHHEAAVDKQSPVCVLCEFVMMQLKQELDDNATMADIENALHRVCQKMPRSIADDCSAFVDNYGPAILDALRAAVADPDTVCQEIMLCKPTEEEEGESSEEEDMMMP